MRRVARGVPLLALLAAGCGGASSPADVLGGARVVARITAGADARMVTQVRVRVSAGEGSAFPAIAAVLRREGDQWSGRIDRIPPGPGRQFDAVGEGAGGEPLLGGSARATIAAGGVTVVAISLSPAEPHSNAPPVIDGVTLSAAEVRRRAVVDVAVAAHDPDPADTLEYRWSADDGCGTFADPASPSTRWTAPAHAASCALTITVTDPWHGSVSQARAVVVVNPPPVIARIAATSQPGLALVGTVEVEASDPEGDPLTYGWSSSCPGTAFGPALARTGFSIPGPSAGCQLTAAVSDGDSTVTASVALPENRPPAAQLGTSYGAQVAELAGLAYDGQGAIYLAGTALAPGYDFGSGFVPAGTPWGAYVARLDPATGRASWARPIGGGERAVGVAVWDGQVGVIGSAYGEVDLGGVQAYGPGGGSFVAGLRAADGAPLWVKSVDLGDGGLTAIAGTPARRRVAVCGAVLDGAAADLDPTAVSGGGWDVVLAVIDPDADDAHRVVWGRQLAAAGDQSCNAVALDDAGDVVVTGQYRGAPFPLGPGVRLPAPRDGEGFAWVARFAGATGALAAATAVGCAGGCVAVPSALAAGPDGAVAVAGSFVGALRIGDTTLTSASRNVDAFAVELLGEDLHLAAGWPIRLGGPFADGATGIAFDSRGDIHLAGYLYDEVTGVASLTGAGSTDAFLLRLGPGGDLAFADRFGDEQRQEATALVVARLAAPPERDAVWLAGTFAGRLELPPATDLRSPDGAIGQFLVKVR